MLETPASQLITGAASKGAQPQAWQAVFAGMILQGLFQ